MSGLVSGLVLSLWVGIGAQLYPPPPALTRPLSLTTEGCNFTNATGLTWTSTPPLPAHVSVFTTVSNDNK